MPLIPLNKHTYLIKHMPSIYKYKHKAIQKIIKFFTSIFQ